MTEVPYHPTDKVLRALSLGQLTDEDIVRISAHLADCPSCCCRIDQLQGDDQLVVRLQQSAARREDSIASSVQRRPAVRALRHAYDSISGLCKRDSVVHTVPKQIGDYDILGEVGRGAMGVVYKARHRRLNRLVALKMVLAGEFASPALEHRFRLEAELAARVQHPNIVHVYEIGSYEGRPFLAMEWVEGGSMASRLDGDPWPARDAAELVETLARALTSHIAKASFIEI